ncbi:dehydratase [Pueribacillus theae]|uniref:Dehydratase n=1 Tax=Pueribacillus theae TaxID=2171751 RepID=A0A2U1JM51_9BACI|nr:MaoC/PaaZ C-terminal domain-containing protein [Pueribacillus theae]PWA06059.1 dehydratase [Pueribacillus theae]
MGVDRYWDDYNVGEIFTTTGRTVTDSDIRMFFGATDASHPAHVDAEYCKQHPFGKIVVPGALTIGIVDGFVLRDVVSQRLKIAHYGYDKIRFLRPVCPGDTIFLEVKVLDKKERNEEFGVVTFEYKVKNQKNESVAIIHDLQMIEKRQVKEK